MANSSPCFKRVDSSAYSSLMASSMDLQISCNLGNIHRSLSMVLPALLPQGIFRDTTLLPVRSLALAKNKTFTETDLVSSSSSSSSSYPGNESWPAGI